MKRWTCLLLGVCLLFAMTGCAPEDVVSEPDSSPAVSHQGGQNLPASATGEYNGQTITMSYKVTDVRYPWDMRSIEMQQGYAVFYDYSWYEEYKKTGTHPYEGGTWNIMDRNGNVLLDEPYSELRPFNKDGITVAKKQDGSYVRLNTKLEETTITEQECTAFRRDNNNDICEEWVSCYSCVYDGLAIYVEYKDGVAYAGLADKDKHVIIPAFIPIYYNDRIESLHLSEDVAFVEDEVSGNIAIITVTRS